MFITEIPDIQREKKDLSLTHPNTDVYNVLLQKYVSIKIGKNMRQRLLSIFETRGSIHLVNIKVLLNILYTNLHNLK